MKRTLSLILAALLLASSMTACGNTAGKTEPKETEPSNETKVTETSTPATDPAATDAPATNAPETDAPETDAPAPSYDPSMITENGVAKAHIVLPEGASDLEKTAADELALHLKLVSGAEVSITNTTATDSLPIVIATPDSLPELETLFPEDLAWLRIVEEDGEIGIKKRWGDDGFAIRALDGKVYIFGVTPVGALNGTYDFIEENLGVIWIGKTEAGIIYDEMPTVNVVKADYREKSPFIINCRGANGDLYMQRNKQYVTEYPYGPDANVKDLLLSSPSYDPNITEYWDTDKNGNPLDPSDSKSWDASVGGRESKQVNFWSQLTADTIGDGVIAALDSFSDADRPKYFNVCMEDNYEPSVYPDMTLPFEYAPGQFVDPADPDYLSTVYFTFINRVARKVAERYPDVYINTLAYQWAVEAPRCELDENVSMWFCPMDEDYNVDCIASGLELEDDGFGVPLTKQYAQQFEAWKEKQPDTPRILYNYYFCCAIQGLYERPIWWRLQKDFQYYADSGLIGMTACGMAGEGSKDAYAYAVPGYEFTYGDAFSMNLMTYWIYYKLMWDPYEDVEALIVKFCDKVYGDASEHMQEYYRVLKAGWDEGAEIRKAEFNGYIGFSSDLPTYSMYYLDIETPDGVYVLDALKDALTKAWEAADDQAKEFIRYPYELYRDFDNILR